MTEGVFTEEQVKRAEELLKKHDSFIKAITAGSEVKIKAGNVETSAFNPETKTITISPNRIVAAKEKGELKGLASLFHELGHLRHLLSDPQLYLQNFRKFQNPEKQKFFDLYNVCDDIQIEHELRVFPPIKEAREESFKEEGAPKEEGSLANQFLYALKTKGVFGEVPKGLDKRVVEAVDGLKNQNIDLIDLLKRTEKAKYRYPLIEKFFEPVYERFLKQDKEEKRPASGGMKQEPLLGMSEASLEKLVKMISEELETPEEKARRSTLKSNNITEEQASDYNEDFQEVKPHISKLADELEKMVNESISNTYKIGKPSDKGQIFEVNFVPSALPLMEKNLNPPLFRKIEPYKKKALNYPKEVKITMIGDMSGSMNNSEKDALQRRSAVLLMEGVDEYAKRLKKKRQNLHLPKAGFEIKTEIRRFGEHDRELKPDYTPLTQNAKIEVHKNLSNPTEGSTKPHYSLEKVLEKIDKKESEKLRKGEKKHIIMVLTDGEFHDQNETTNTIKKLEEKGVEVWGIGITKESKVENSFNKWVLIENPKQLPEKIGKLIQERVKGSITNVRRH